MLRFSSYERARQSIPVKSQLQKLLQERICSVYNVKCAGYTSPKFWNFCNESGQIGFVRSSDQSLAVFTEHYVKLK